VGHHSAAVVGPLLGVLQAGCRTALDLASVEPFFLSYKMLFESKTTCVRAISDNFLSLQVTYFKVGEKKLRMAMLGQVVATACSVPDSSSGHKCRHWEEQ